MFTKKINKQKLQQQQQNHTKKLCLVYYFQIKIILFDRVYERIIGFLQNEWNVN